MEKRSIRMIHILRALGLLAAAACIALGVSRGEVSIVLRKAIRICLECIGVAG